MRFFNNKDKSIMCPKCGKFLTKADKEDDRVHKLACKNCKKWIWFTPKTEVYEIYDIPIRISSSGKRYY